MAWQLDSVFQVHGIAQRGSELLTMLHFLCVDSIDKDRLRSHHPGSFVLRHAGRDARINRIGSSGILRACGCCVNKCTDCECDRDGDDTFGFHR
jgi:hypothetical protein